MMLMCGWRRNGIGLNVVVMLHAIRESIYTSNAHGWHPCSLAARQLLISPCYNGLQIAEGGELEVQILNIAQ